MYSFLLVNTNWGTEMPFWLRYPIRALQIFGRSIDDTGNIMLPALSDDSTSGGFKIINYSQGLSSMASKTSLHSEDAKDFIWNHTKEIISKLTK